MRVVDIEAALDASMLLIEKWRHARLNPGVPLYSGGIWDAWPARDVEALAVLSGEFTVIESFLRNEELERLKSKGARRG